MSGGWFEPRIERLAWIAAGLITFVLSLIITFPYDALQMRLTSELQRATGLSIRASDWSIAWPVGIEWRRISVAAAEGEPVEVGLLRANLQLLSLLGGRLSLDFSVQVDETARAPGLVRFTLSSSWSAQGPWSLKGQLQHVELSRLFPRYMTRGTLNGNFSHQNTQTGSITFIRGDGTLTVTATNVSIDSIPLGNGRTLSLSFASLFANLDCHDSLCTIKELKGEGDDGSFTGDGTLALQQPLGASRLAVNVTIVPGLGSVSKATALGLPSLPLGTPLMLKIVGPLAQPRITL
ncbi:MAG: type II secretion system protein GspN [Nitrospira sp.]|nr:type II secretion system protein GspN [Nitrospira sp.]